MFEEYIQKTGKVMRLGYTTGSCAALSAKAATRMLLTGTPCYEIAILTPKGIPLSVLVEDICLTDDGASCAVRKDAGDDPDITDGVLVYARVAKTASGIITIDGGEGVGRVTRKGLNQPVGAAAINQVPRQMIEQEVGVVCEECGYDGGISVLISVPNGESLAKKTFNPYLGIEGGLSIIGTSGIVEPMSTQAILDTIDTEMKMYAAEGVREIIFTPGNYGQKFLLNHPTIALRQTIKCSNFIGESLDMAAFHGFTSVLIVGHIGKLAKLAGGIMNTHSSMADGRRELLALHAALVGGNVSLLKAILATATADEALSLIDKAELRYEVMKSLLDAADSYLARRAKGALLVGALTFSHQIDFLEISAAGQEILEQWGHTHE